MPTGFVWLERYAWHNTGNHTGTQPFPHPESPESKARFASLVEVSGLGSQLERLPVVMATKEDILRIHHSEHLARIEEESKRPKGGDAGDGESPFGHGAYELALYAAGGTIAAVDAVMQGRCANAYALVRPPGHHAVRETGMGFCIFANVAVAIEHARAHFGVTRVAVVDWDVHHGNGTQSIFYRDAAVLTISIHQDSLFPLGSGRVEETGEAEGVGANLNIPLPPGSGNGAYVETIERVVLPALRRFKPEIILVASGFDASAADPLGRMMVTTTGYRTMTRLLLEAADELCDGRVVMSHEGGYSATYVPFCGLAVLETLAGVDVGVPDPATGYYDLLPGQQLADHQRVAIAAAAANVGLVPQG